MEKNKSDIKLTIIVPIYKVEEYIGRCLDSIVKQNCIENKIEIMLVDDGSPDRCGEICDAFVAEHEFAKVIHKPNGGLSDARNVGIDNATGEYCMFLDSDDSLVENVCSAIINKINQFKCDVIYSQIRWINSEHIGIYEKSGIKPNNVYSGMDALGLELMHDRFAAMSQLGVYRRLFLLKNQLYFKKGILHEDEHWSPRVMLKANSIVKIDIETYNYYIRENSITTNTNTKRFHDMLGTIEELRTIYDNCVSMEIRKYGNQYLAKLYMNAASNIIKSGESLKIDSTFLLKNLHGMKNKLKYLLFIN